MKTAATALLMVTALLGAKGAAWAQSAVENPPPSEASFEGWHIFRAETHTGYMSLALPNANFNYLLGTVPIGSDVQSGGSVSLGWRRTRRHSSLELTYEPTYYALARHSEWNSLNHSLTFHGSRQLANKWNSNFSLAGGSSNLNGFLFTPPVLANLAGVSGSFTALADAVLAGRFSNGQIASILTGAPVLESPGRTMIYGTRVLTASFSSSVSYARSTRLGVHFGVSGSHSQGLNDGQNSDAWQRDILQRTSAGTASVGLSYTITPRTNLGVEATGGRTISDLQDAYNTNATISLGRKIGTRWFLQGAGGVGFITPLRQTYQLYQPPQGPQPVARASFGYKTWRQSFMATVDRTPDLSGMGGGYTFAAGGAWTWHNPAGAWQFSSSLRQQRMRGGWVQELDGWMGSVTVGRTLNRHSAVQLTYSYLDNSGTYLGAARDMSVQAVQLAIVWQGQQGR